MNLRALEKQAEKLTESIAHIQKYTQKKIAERANALSLFKTSRILIETLHTKLTEVKEKQHSMNEKEYITYFDRFLSALYSEECEKSIFTDLNSQLIHLEDNIDDLGLELDPSEIRHTLNKLEECEWKLMQLMEAISDRHIIRQAKHKVRHPSADSSVESCDSSDEESQSTESKKRKFDEVSVSNNPDTLFASESKRAKVEEKIDSLGIKR